ncbi:glycoside hydrolase [Anaerocolumna xylanovorans]|uniref:Polysaccharide deacetylase n=1 Tax=Anaerocolumna xylanovorans DSM 12503 TaxID=1121345 RepID=A0A1M7YMW4_9FIRM|nr:glycoside hydrolase [Anaerocolumna xylanovorans]SHO53950.1 hypothetical protein SAMN02745217_04388 [Anaerocolumna xylanovorans DSM 12503]
MKGKHLSKNKKKIIRSILEAALLMILAVVIIRALFVMKSYEPYEESKAEMGNGTKDGFTAISYIAVDREGTSGMIGVRRLKEQLKALYDNGYVTITQSDILDYYKNGKALPKKALFLIFEDGRRDTAIFAQKIMEKYNFKGTMLSYADRLGSRDSKFLTPKDLLNLKKSGYWELGTNGYRLSYINVFDRYQNFLGELNSLEYVKLRKYLDRNYNQYLMDYIRDAYGIPKESYEEMKDRISEDYRLMQEVYTKELGKVPDVYVLMHSNTGSFGNNDKVSEVNKEWITGLFSMNFNREGYSYNTAESSLYDLTRMQPQPYWYPNHLLMRIKDDSKADIKFVDGDVKRKISWETVKGAAEYKDSDIILTSESQGSGLLRLKDSGNYDNLDISLLVTGNKLGSQAVYLRGDEKLTRYTAVRLQNNYFVIEEDGKELYKLNLDEFDGKAVQSLEENKQEALWEEYEIYRDGSSSFRSKTYMEEQKKPGTGKARSVSEGAKPYLSDIPINEAGNRKIDVTLEGNNLTVKIDGKIAADKITVENTRPGYVYLESAWGEYGYSQRNIADDVYDGVFRDFVIWDSQNKSTAFYDNRLKGMEKVQYTIKNKWNNLINWFIKTL